MIQSDSYVTRSPKNKASLWKNRELLLGQLDMELTERCNNNCIHCCINLPAKDHAAKSKELSAREIKQILKEAAALGCVKVRFTGGEPLLRGDFEELYVFARKLGLKVLLFTNATLITPPLADLFKRIPPLEKIEVSVYGMKKASYEAVTRAPGSFKAFRRGVVFLLKNKIPFIVKGALLPPNKNEIEAFETWAATIPWMDRPPSYAMFLNLRRRRDDPKKNLAIKDCRLSAEAGLRVTTRKKEAYIKEMQEFCSKIMRPPGDKLFFCGAGCGNGCVDAYGYFQPCLMLRHPDTVYDLRKGSLKDALTHFFPKLREMKTTNPDYLNRCAGCFLKGLCEQCPARSWNEHGALDTPVEYLCEIAHGRARFLGMIKDGENAWEVKKWQKRIEEFCAKAPKSF